LVNRRVLMLLFVAASAVGMTEAQVPSGQQSAHASPNPSSHVLVDGRWWMGLSDESKNKFVDGYKTAMTGAFNTLGAECVDAAKDAKPGGLEALVKVYENVCKLAASFDFEFEEHDIRQGLDNFYKDSPNMRIPIDVAMRHVREVLQSKRPPAGIGGGSR
jgi:hypothetical protein